MSGNKQKQTEEKYLLEVNNLKEYNNTNFICDDFMTYNFDVAFDDGNFTFSVRGYGHGVGMSQYGAQFMALQGSTYTDILMWYYTDCTIGTYSIT